MAVCPGQTARGRGHGQNRRDRPASLRRCAARLPAGPDSDTVRQNVVGNCGRPAQPGGRSWAARFMRLRRHSHISAQANCAPTELAHRYHRVRPSAMTSPHYIYQGTPACLGQGLSRRTARRRLPAPSGGAGLPARTGQPPEEGDSGAFSVVAVRRRGRDGDVLGAQTGQADSWARVGGPMGEAGMLSVSG